MLPVGLLSRVRVDRVQSQSELVRAVLCWTVLLAAGLTLLAPSHSAQAQLPRVRLNSVFPAGGQAGSDVTVVISGELADAATELVFSHPEIEATQQIEGPSEYRVAHRRAKTFDVRIGDDVPNGRYEVRALGAAGLSGPRIFCVSRLSEKVFDAGGNSRQKPFPTSIGEIVNGKARNDQRDYFQFTAAGGKSVLIQLWAQRIDSKMDPELAVYSAKTGKRLGRVAHSLTRDPAMTFLPPEDGEYVIEVWEKTYRGGEEYVYRLEVCDRPRVEAIHPVVAKPGEEADFKVYGFNLPGGTNVSGTAGLGNLQWLDVSFAPDFETDLAFVSGLPNGDPASARIDGASIELPTPLAGANNVFLAKARGQVLRERENESAETAQPVSLPCTVAGQFYPKRDTDWYSFDAKRGDVYWFELTTQCFGAPSDGRLRIQQRVEKDGKLTFKDVAQADDVEGPPANRDARRFYSGTSDCVLRFQAKEDATYVVSVVDQYNVINDDPRLVYELNIGAEKPDFQLVAFADPELHGDVKIVKPNGVTLIPGASSVVRVRMLPQHGFNETVDVMVEGLPKGVSASALTLNSRMPEGYLMLTATKDASASFSVMKIIGSSQVGDVRVVRTARSGAISHGVNNADQLAATVRLTQSMPLAVVDSKPTPVVLQPVLKTLVTSIGAKLSVPMNVVRQEKFDAEVELTAVQVPKGLKVGKVKTKDAHASLVVTLDDKNLPPGRYTFPFHAKVKEKRARNTIVVKEAEDDLAKISSLLDSRIEELTLDEKKQADANADLVATEAKLVAMQSQASEPRNRLIQQLNDELKAANDLSKKLAKLAADVTNQQLLAEVAAVEEVIEQHRRDRGQIQANVATTLAPIAELTSVLSQKKARFEQLKKEHATRVAKKAETEKQKQEAEKRLADAKKAQLETDAEYFIYSPAIEFDVRRSPVELRVVPSVQLQAGATVEIPVRVKREFGFDGQLSIQCKLPADANVSSATLVVGRGQSVGKLLLNAAADAKPGKWTSTIESTLKFNNIDITDKAMCQVEVMPEAG